MPEASLQSLLLALNSAGVYLQPPSTSSTSLSFSARAFLRQARRRSKLRRMRRRLKLSGGSRRPALSLVEKRVRDLRRLVLAGESMELEELVREAADYIECLQVQVKLMQIMVNVFSGGSSGKD